MGTASKTLVSGGDRSNTVIFIASGAMLLGAAFFLFAVSPAMVDRFRLIAGATDRTAAALFWLLPAAAAGIAFGGAALGLMTIVRVVRELEDNPFAWLAPLLAVFCAVMIGGVQFELPISAVEKSHFAVLSAFLFVGGGAVALLPHWSRKALGVALSVFPVAAFILAYTLQQGGPLQAWSAADKSVLYVLTMLVGTCIAILFIAFSVGSVRAPMFGHGLPRASRPESASYGYPGAVAEQDWQQFEQGRAMLRNAQEELERDKNRTAAEIEKQYRQLQAQYDALRAEREQFQRDQEEIVQQLELTAEQQEQVAAQQQRLRLSDDTSIVRALAKKGINPLLTGAAVLLIAGAVGGVYLGWVQPTRERMTKETELSKQKAEKQEQAIRALAQKLEAQRIEIEQQEQELQDARQAATEARAEADEAAKVLSETEQATADEGKVAAKAAKSKAPARRTKAAKRAKRAPRRKAATGKGAVVNRDDDPIAGISGI